MSRFSVRVHGEGAEERREKLDAAGIPTIGPAYAKFMDAPGDWTPGRMVTAVVDAVSPDAAAVRVREIVGDDCDVDDPQPYGKVE